MWVLLITASVCGVSSWCPVKRGSVSPLTNASGLQIPNSQTLLHGRFNVSQTLLPLLWLIYRQLHSGSCSSFHFSTHLHCWSGVFWVVLFFLCCLSGWVLHWATKYSFWVTRSLFDALHFLPQGNMPCFIFRMSSSSLCRWLTRKELAKDSCSSSPGMASVFSGFESLDVHLTYL